MAEDPGNSERAPESLRKAQRVAEAMRDGLLNALEPGDGIPSQSRLARQYGVSRRTIHQALKRLVDDGWLTHISGTYDYVLARPRRRPVKTSAFICLFQVEDLVWLPFFREAMVGVHRESHRQGRQVLSFFGQSRLTRDFGTHAWWSPNFRAVDSAIMLDVFSTKFIARFARLYPVVSVDGPSQVPGVSVAAPDHPSCIRMAFKYLLDLGHRRIGYVSRAGTTDPAVVERFAAFEGALRWAGIAGNPEWILHCTSAGDYAPWIDRLLRQPRSKRPSAVISTADSWALIAHLRARTAVPGDISIVAIDDAVPWPETLKDLPGHVTSSPYAMNVLGLVAQELAHDMIHPVLSLIQPTRIRIPFEQMGCWAVTEVARRLADPSAAPARQFFAPTLVAGNTAGPARP